jgi:hypothetical protein
MHCGPAAMTCPMGSALLCARAGDCRCGTICENPRDCAGRDVCVRTTNPQIPGICADPLWALPDAPCIPFCQAEQVCVQWRNMPNSCASRCQAHSDCGSNCCIPLNGENTKVCGDARYCEESCIPSCLDSEVCVALGARPSCAARCRFDEDCPRSCCLPLQGGGGICPPNGEFCPQAPPPVCEVLERCANTSVMFEPAGENSCGTVGRYTGTVSNFCNQPAYCRVCWYSTQTMSYSDCEDLGLLRNGVTVPAGTARCADATLPNPELRIKCVSERSIREGVNCLGNGPL